MTPEGKTDEDDLREEIVALTARLDYAATACADLAEDYRRAGKNVEAATATACAEMVRRIADGPWSASR